MSASLPERRSRSVPRPENANKRRRSIEEQEQDQDVALTKKFCRLTVNKKRIRGEDSELLDMLDELELENKKKRRKPVVRSRSLDPPSISTFKSDASGKYLRFIYDSSSRGLDLHRLHMEHKERRSDPNYIGPNLPLGKPTPSAKPFSSTPLGSG